MEGILASIYWRLVYFGIFYRGFLSPVGPGLSLVRIQLVV